MKSAVFWLKRMNKESRDLRDLCMLISRARHLLWKLMSTSYTILQGLTRTPVGIWTLLTVRADLSVNEILKCTFHQGNSWHLIPRHGTSCLTGVTDILKKNRYILYFFKSLVFLRETIHHQSLWVILEENEWRSTTDL